jgi:hypothetical protein
MTTSFWVRPLQPLIARQLKGGGPVSPKMQLLLIALGLVALAALNASSPWGP